MLCLLAPAVCVHNKPLLTIKLQPGQLPGERTLIPSTATSAALELSLYTYLSQSVFPLTCVVKAGPGRRCPETDSLRSTVFHLPSVFSGHSHSLMPLGSHNTRILQHPPHTSIASFTRKAVHWRKQEQHCVHIGVTLAGTHEDLGVFSGHFHCPPGAGDLRLPSTSPARGLQSETFTLRAREYGAFLRVSEPRLTL